MSIFPDAVRLDRTFFANLADGFAIGVAIAMPWSTSATGILIAVWLVFVLAALDPDSIKRELSTAAGALPVLLWCLGAVGMLWADVPWTARLGGLDGFMRLLTFPLLLAQFRRSNHGGWVICGFFFSCVILLVLSFILVLVPSLNWPGHVPGVPAHDTNFQGSAFLICGFGALGYAVLARKKLLWRRSFTMFGLGVLFLLNFAVATASRSSLIILPILLLLLGWRLLRWKGILWTCSLAVVIGAVTLFASPVLRGRVEASIKELQEYRAANKATSIGEHLAFLEESLKIIASAPLIGHGTGSIPEQFRRVTTGQTGVSGLATVNPHNQTFAVAVQLGVFGAVLLWTMWLAHLALFRGESAIAWLGFVTVIENVISSVAHSHLFDFNNGWLYVFAVGVLGGMILRERVLSFLEPSSSKSYAANTT
jgi:O-antigen ligase